MVGRSERRHEGGASTLLTRQVARCRKRLNRGGYLAWKKLMGGLDILLLTHEERVTCSVAKLIHTLSLFLIKEQPL